MKFPTMDEFAQMVADKALDEVEYNGKTLRQWIEIILATDINVATKDGTNLASLGTDCISRQQAIDAFNTNIDELVVSEKENAEAVERYLNRVIDEIKQLPPIQPKRGRWIKLDMHRGMADHKCTACKQECYVPTCMGEPMYAFCPNCGAKMGVNHEID